MQATSVVPSLAFLGLAGCAGAPAAVTAGAAPRQPGDRGTTRTLDDFASVAAWQAGPASGVHMTLLQDTGRERY